MGQAVQLLENALRAWEDLQLINEAYLRYSIHSGDRKSQDLLPPFKHWRQLRRHLLMSPTQGFDHSRFCLLEDANEGDSLYAGTGAFYNEVPLQMASWLSSSRRVFTLSDELVQRFLAADYSNYTWSDLLWPFDSFFITIEKPFVFDDLEGGTSAISAFLVSSISQICPEYPRVEKDGLEIGYFYTAKNGVEYPSEILSKSDRHWLNHHLINRQWAKLGKHVLKATDTLFPTGEEDAHLYVQPAGGIDPLVLKKGAPITEVDSLAPMIIAGLCLYLEALPSSIVESYGWGRVASPKARRDIRKIITDEEQICRVEDFHVLSPGTMTLFPETLRQGPAYTVTPHWRRAHYRRARGQGHNPNAPRDVYVGPTLIHKDQVPEGALPGGSVSSLR